MTNLPIEGEKGFVAKIKKFFRDLFSKNEEANLFDEKEEKTVLENNSKDEFEKELKVEIKENYSKELKKKDFVKDFEEHPEKLWDLSNERLKQLDKYYDEEIEELQKQINNLKKVG